LFQGPGLFDGWAFYFNGFSFFVFLFDLFVSAESHGKFDGRTASAVRPSFDERIW